MQISPGIISKERKSIKPNKIKKKQLKVNYKSFYAYHANNEFSQLLGIYYDAYSEGKKRRYYANNNFRCQKFIKLFYKYDKVAAIVNNENFKPNYIKPMLSYYHSTTEKNYIFEKRRFEQDMTKRFEDKPQKKKRNFDGAENYLWKFYFSNELV